MSYSITIGNHKTITITITNAQQNRFKILIQLHSSIATYYNTQVLLTKQVSPHINDYKMIIFGQNRFKLIIQLVQLQLNYKSIKVSFARKECFTSD